MVIANEKKNTWENTCWVLRRQQESATTFFSFLVFVVGVLSSQSMPPRVGLETRSRVWNLANFICGVRQREGRNWKLPAPLKEKGCLKINILILFNEEYVGKKRKKRTSRGWNALNCVQRLLADLKDLRCRGNAWMHKLLISFLPVENQNKKNIHSDVRAILSRFNDAPLQPKGFFLHSPKFHLSPVVVVWQAPPTGMRPHQSPSRPVFTSSLWLPCSRAGWSWN